MEKASSILIIMDAFFRLLKFKEKHFKKSVIQYPSE